MGILTSKAQYLDRKIEELLSEIQTVKKRLAASDFAGAGIFEEHARREMYSELSAELNRTQEERLRINVSIAEKLGDHAHEALHEKYAFDADTQLVTLPHRFFSWTPPIEPISLTYFEEPTPVAVKYPASVPLKWDEWALMGRYVFCAYVEQHNTLLVVLE